MYTFNIHEIFNQFMFIDFLRPISLYNILLCSCVLIVNTMHFYTQPTEK